MIELDEIKYYPVAEEKINIIFHNVSIFLSIAVFPFLIRKINQYINDLYAASF